MTADLARLDIRIRADGDRLIVDARRGTLTPELRAELKARKWELLASLLLAETADAEVREHLAFCFRERAAITEIDGNRTRTEAEHVAFIDLRMALERLRAQADGGAPREPGDEVCP